MGLVYKFNPLGGPVRIGSDIGPTPITLQELKELFGSEFEFPTGTTYSWYSEIGSVYYAVGASTDDTSNQGEVLVLYDKQDNPLWGGFLNLGVVGAPGVPTVNYDKSIDDEGVNRTVVRWTPNPAKATGTIALNSCAHLLHYSDYSNKPSSLAVYARYEENKSSQGTKTGKMTLGFPFTYGDGEYNKGAVLAELDVIASSWTRNYVTYAIDLNCGRKYSSGRGYVITSEYCQSNQGANTTIYCVMNQCSSVSTYVIG